MDELKNLLKDLYLISGLNMSIFDIHEKLMVSYPTYKSSFCHLIEQNEAAFKHCQHDDHHAFMKVKETGQIYIYQCHYHLYEACVPLYTYGTLSGYLMMGQTLSSSPIDQKQIITKALPYIQDQEILESSLTTISRHSKEQILAFASIVNICAQYLTLTNRIRAKQQNLAQEINSYLQKNYAYQITIDSLCDYFYCSKATLHTHFKENYHISIHQYLLKIRLQKSLELLHQKHLSISEIAYSCGFTDPHYFSKAFKKAYHCTPREYRSHIE